MFGRRRLVLVLPALALLWLAPGADASLRAKSSLATESDATRIVVKLTSTRRLPARARPRAVRVRAGGRTYRLKRAGRRASAAAVSLGRWRSAAFRGSAAERLLAAAGKRVAVMVRSRAGTTSLRSKLAAPRDSAPPGGDSQPPGGTDGTAPPGDSAPPGGAQQGDITGQQAIDQLTAEIRGGFVRRFQTSGDLSETFELHLCVDGTFRFYHHQSQLGLGPFAVEKLGNPWTVAEALVRGDGSYRGARVTGTFTHQNRLNGASEAINEPAETRIENQGGQWYWDGQPVETGNASCNSALFRTAP